MKKGVEKKVQDFFVLLASKYPELTQEEMKKMWNQCKKKKSSSKKMNSYNLFTREATRQISGMSFVERSREIGRRWKALSSEEKEQFKRRAKLYQTYQYHEGWDYYLQKPRNYVLHVARNWFEDDPSIQIEDTMSTEEVVELLLLHTDVKPDAPHDDEASDDTPPKKEEEIIPLEVHPYYYQLVQKSLDALHRLCDKNFKPEVWRESAANRRALMELLIRHFDHLELE
jgi:hypothetical protein